MKYSTARENDSHLGVLQRGLIAGGSVVHPLRGFGVDVAQVQLLHQLIQVMMQVLLLHPQQLQLVHGEVQASGAVAVAAALVAPQLVTHVRQPGPELARGASAAAVQPLTELFRHRRRVTHHLTSQDAFIPTVLQ